MTVQLSSGDVSIYRLKREWAPGKEKAPVKELEGGWETEGLEIEGMMLEAAETAEGQIAFVNRKLVAWFAQDQCGMFWIRDNQLQVGRWRPTYSQAGELGKMKFGEANAPSAEVLYAIKNGKLNLCYPIRDDAKPATEIKTAAGDGLCLYRLSRGR